MVKKVDRDVYLVHQRRFKLGTQYATVLGYLGLLESRLERVHRHLIDQTGVGEVFVEEAIKSGLKNAQGIMLSLPSKQQVMVYLKQLMQEGRIHIPFDMDLINELNVERYELTKTGQIQFSHPEGTHDDRLWAFALAVYASRPEVPQYQGTVIRGHSQRLKWRPRPTGFMPPSPANTS